MDGDREKQDNMTRVIPKLSTREFPCYVKLRDDVCYLLKFREDAKGQDVMDEVNNLEFLFFSKGSKVQLFPRQQNCLFYIFFDLKYSILL